MMGEAAAGWSARNYQVPTPYLALYLIRVFHVFHRPKAQVPFPVLSLVSLEEGGAYHGRTIALYV